MHFVKKIFPLFIFINAISFAQNSNSDMGNWIMFFNQTKLHNKWSIHSEIQFRSYELFPNTEQLLIRGGINYHQNANVLFTAGYGWITNYKDDGEIFKNYIINENRLWQQILIKDNFNRLFLEHRYRLEQRWIEQKNANNYKNRIRYLLRITIPLNKKEITKQTIFIGIYNEVFIHLDKNPFDRNRLYGAMGYQFAKFSNLQLGYMAQTIGSKTKYYLQIGLNYNPDLRKKPAN